MKKLNKKLKIYINYKIINVFIVFNRNISLLIKETLFKLYIIRIYNKFDIIFIFNETRVKKHYIKKSIFLLNINFMNISLYYSVFIIRLLYFRSL